MINNEIHRKAQANEKLSAHEFSVFYNTCPVCFEWIKGTYVCGCPHGCEEVFVKGNVWQARKAFYAESLEPTGTMADYCYGRRVYIHRRIADQNPEIVEFLDSMSCWGGSDKDHDGWLGWELTIDREAAERLHWQICQKLQEEGFERLCQCPWR